ncbi:glycosyl hydrolase [Konateibacter massiliensis]|uniref:glycosyl hydrolase n=1 Tax=Konateibacter massiliensis TaxID=2002841 RepID=UPI000C15EC97|nr:glycosyl hydrolase [Konateibacter massiliensis]
MDIETLKIWDELPMNMRPKIRYWLPAAAVEEEDIRKEIQALYERGFGGVEVVSLIVSDAAFLNDIVKGDAGWGGERWNCVMKVVSEETGRLGMSMDITNGPGWPISSPTILSADDEAVLCELTFGEMMVNAESDYTGELPSPRSIQSEGKTQLVHAMAYLQKNAGILLTDSYIDLMPYVETVEDKEILSYRFPKAEKESWKVFAFYSQPAIQKTNVEQCYVIDHLSEKGARACENYWDTIFSEHCYDSMESFFCDSLEYKVSLDWTPDLLEEFQKRRGYSLLPYLPFIGSEGYYPPCDVPGYQSEGFLISDMVNNDYKETLTQLYCENHLSALEKMAKKYGKTIRYQAAYNKPLEVERSGLFVTVPENEALGRPALDFQKTMAAAVHLGRKERYSFECAAEFGNSYGQDYEDLFWWVKRSLMAGMNAQVLHGASYSGGYKGEASVNGNLPNVQWPGFEGFMKKVSNNWNRTLSVSDARACMDTITRLNILFRKSAKVDCVIFRASYLNDGLGSEFCLYDDGGALSNSGYSYEFISEYLLQMAGENIVQDHVFDKEGAGYKCLIIPETEKISTEFLCTIKRFVLSGLPIVWVGEKPVCSRYYGEWSTDKKQKEWKIEMDLVWNLSGIAHVDNLEMVPKMLKQLEVKPEIWLEGEMDIATATRVEKEGQKKYFMLYGYNRVEYAPNTPNTNELACSAVYKKGTTKGSYVRPGSVSRKNIQVRLKGMGTVYRCNPWSGKKEKEIFFYDKNTGYMTGRIEIEEDEMVIFALFSGEMEEKEKAKVTVETYPVQFTTLELEEFKPNAEQEISFLRSRFSADKIRIDLNSLMPWRMLDEKLEHFGGRGTYSGFIDIKDEKPDDRKYILSLGNVSDTFTVFVNDQPADFPDQVMKRVDITELLHSGRNTIKIVVTSNLYNRVFVEDPAKGLRYLPRDYGIWENEYKKVELRVYKR